MSTRPKASRHLTLSQALEELFGIEATRNERQRFARALARKEAATDKPIGFRSGKGCTLYVTEAVLRDRMPEMFSRRDRTLELVKEELDGLKDKIKESKKKTNVLASRYRSLRSEFTAHLESHRGGPHGDGVRQDVVYGPQHPVGSTAS